jgi:hypothetical protein
MFEINQLNLSVRAWQGGEVHSAESNNLGMSWLVAVMYKSCIVLKTLISELSVYLSFPSAAFIYTKERENVDASVSSRNFISCVFDYLKAINYGQYMGFHCVERNFGAGDRMIPKASWLACLS